MRVHLLSATGNRFALLDLFEGEIPADVEERARAWCAPEGHDVDGLLLLCGPLAGGDCRMVLYNADGSRAEACGNGLRCIAKLAVERGHVGNKSVVIETDAGDRRVEVTRDGERVRYVCAEMGTPRLEAREETLETTRGPVRVTLVDMGNPHCVLFVNDVRTAPVAALGTELEKHARFPNRTNVEFCSIVDRALEVRVWERGVGETAACGTGAAAAAVAAIVDARIEDPFSTPLEVRMRGGALRVEWNGRGVLKLGGAVEEIEAGHPVPRGG